MTKIFKKFFMVISLCLVMVLSLFTVAACTNSDGKEITPEFAYAKLNEDVEGRTRKDILLNSYDTYKYLELEFSVYDEETLELVEITKLYIRNVITKENEVLKEVDQQVFIESYSYKTELTSYSLLKRELNHVEYYTSIKEGDDVAKNAGEMLDLSAFDAYLAALLPSVYDAKYFPEDETCISAAYKKTMSTNVNNMLTLDIRFKNADDVSRGLVFNYDTNKIHYVREYNTDGALLYEVEYTYPGNIATDVKEINYDLFAMHIHTAGAAEVENLVESTCSVAGGYDEVIYCISCQEEISRETKVIERLECTPTEPVEENRVEPTCIEKGHYDEVVYCSVCESEISRETKELDFAECVDNDENGVCDICKTGGKAKIGEVYYATFEEALANVGEGNVVIELLANAMLDYNAREAYGTTETTSITINGNGKILTLNQKDSDWSSIGLANANGKLVLNDMIIEKTGYGDMSGAWNTHAIIFKSNVEMTNVVVNNSMAVSAGATLTNVTINEANDFYGLWIYANEQTVTVNGGAINATKGRGIKIADQYIDNAQQVTLNVTDTAFNTAKKAAVLVTSTAGASITASNVDITNVAADSTNFVWVDEDRAAHYGKVVVAGNATKAQEGVENFVATVALDGSINAYYATFEEALAAAAPNDEVFILTNLDFATGIEISKEVVINLNGKSLTIKEDTEGNGVFHVVAGGKLTINGDGVVDGSGKNVWCITLWVDGGEAIINGGTYINNCLLEEHSEEQFDMFYVKNGGKLTINGGVFKALTPKWTINKHDSTENTVIITGGTFYGYNPSASETENPVESFVAEGYISIPGKIEGVDIYKVVAFDSI